MIPSSSIILHGRFHPHSAPSPLHLLLLLHFSLFFFLLPIHGQCGARKEAGRIAKRQIRIGNGIGNCLLGIILPPFGASIQYSQGNQIGPFLEGTIARLICSGGLPFGQSSSVCLNGFWQPSLFLGCTHLGLSSSLGGGTGSQCLFGLSSVANGNVLYSLGSQTIGPYPHGTVARLQCLNGILPSGTSSAICLDGLWQPGQLDTCTLGGTVLGQCLMGSPIPLNGAIVYSNGVLLGPFPDGTIATALCNAGIFVPNPDGGGQSSSTCQNGRFTPPILNNCKVATG